jgi:hypothetical protein
MALSANRNTPHKWTSLLGVFKVKGSTHIFNGALVAVDSGGYLVPAGATSGHKAIGRADQEVNNTGADGAATCRVLQGVFKWDNSSGSAETQALVGAACYVEDDHTVGLSESNSIIAGIVIEIDADGGIWVKTESSQGATAAVTGYPSSGATETKTSGALDPAKRTSMLTLGTTAASFTLADGTVEGQRKSVVVATATSNGVGTLQLATSPAAYSTVAFNALWDSVELEWHASGGWQVISQISVTIA